MIYKDSIALYKEITKEYVGNNKEKEVKDFIGNYVCSVYKVRDYVNDVPQGRITGKTLEVYFLQVAPNFKYAEYGDKIYKPTSFSEVGGRSIIELEEVVV